MGRGTLALFVSAVMLISALAACRNLPSPAAGVNLSSDQKELQKADRLAKLGNWEAAGPLFADLEGKFRQKGDLRNALYAHISRFGSEEESTDLQKISQELTATRLLPIVQSDIQLKQRCLEIKAHIDLNLDGVSARPSLEELERVAKERKDVDAESRASGELGILAFLEGNPAEARNRVGTAIAKSVLHGDTGAEIRYLSLMGQGLAETHKASEALWSLDRALAISRNTPEAGFPMLVVSGKASVLTQLRRFAEAHAIINEGLQYARKYGYIGFQVDMLAQSGELAVAENKIDEAIRLYEQAAGLARQIHFNRGLAEVNAKLASLYQRVGNLAQAAKSEEGSINAHLQMGEVYELPHHLALKAKLQEALGSQHAARLTYLIAERIIGTMLRNSPTAGIKRSVIDAMSEVYLGHFQLAVSQQNLEEAFEVIEEARGRVAADRLRSPEQDRRPRPEIAAAERRLALLQIRLLDTQDEQERKRISDSLTEIEQQTPYDEGLNSTDFLSERPTLSNLRSLLGPHEAVLEYVIAEPDSYCVVIKATGAQIIKLPGQRKIDALADKEFDVLKTKGSAYTEGHDLYSAVAEPLMTLVQDDNLIIVPDGKLHRIPFAALVDDEKRYLIQTHTIDYAPSGTVLALFRRSRPGLGKGLLAVGNVSYGQEARHTSKWPSLRGLDSLTRRAFMPLPATQDEIRSVSNAMHDLNGIILSGQNATESNFKRESRKDTSVIHLAVHAFTDKIYPDRAGLVFAGNDPGEDGLLQVREIRRLHLTGTSLVTLSACDTSAGRVEGQEGVSSIVSAFLYAGARTTVASFWSVEDSSTSEFMKIFYQELSQGRAKSAALRAAQLEMLKRGGETKAPFFWAAFGLTGDGSGKVEEHTGNDKR